MNNQYTVTKSFRDKESGQTYGIGSTYDAQDQKRAMELEMGGYICDTNSQAAQQAKAQAQGNQATENNSQQMAQTYQQLQKANEPKTIVNGKVVSLAAAQAAEAYHEAQMNQTGIQEHHSNQTETVASGQVAQNSQNAQAEETQVKMRQSNVQSSQAHLEDAISRSTSTAEAGRAQMYNQSQAQQTGQSSQAQQQSQQAAQTAAAHAEQTNPAAAEAETAAETQRAATKAARAKKENQ
jgi:hypothetical protein